MDMFLGWQICTENGVLLEDTVQISLCLHMSTMINLHLDVPVFIDM